MNISKAIIALLLVLIIGTLSSPRAEAIDQEVLFGGYAYTLRNLETQGMILAYRVWLTKTKAEEKKLKFSLLYPRPVIIGFEVRGGRLHKPDAGWEAELTVDFKYEIDFTWDFGAFIFLAGGGSYSDVDYTNVPTHYNFVTRGGVGLRIERLFLQTAYEHRSNGHLRPPTGAWTPSPPQWGLGFEWGVGSGEWEVESGEWEEYRSDPSNPSYRGRGRGNFAKFVVY